MSKLFMPLQNWSGYCLTVMHRTNLTIALHQVLPRSNMNKISKVLAIVMLLALWAGTCRAESQETVLYSFTNGSDGFFPSGPLTLDSAGNVYGTDIQVAYELSPGSDNTWTFTIVHNFSSSAGGYVPQGGVVFDEKGNLYGATQQGGTTGDGVVYELTPDGSGGWNEEVLYNFTGGNDGGYPNGVTFGSDGNLYGTTNRGGLGQGGVFELQNVSGKWTEQTLYAFTGGTDGGTPNPGIAFDSSGDILGTTYFGGSSDAGVVFALTHSGGTWIESVLYNFTGLTDGQHPSSLILRRGVIYGATTNGGGGGCDRGCGVVFELARDGQTGWKEHVLHAFQNNNRDGNSPLLMFSSGGNLFGVCGAGGSYNYGTVFEMEKTFDGTWLESVQYAFSGGQDGAGPGALVPATPTTFYGTTFEGGLPGNYGTVFQLTP
jgi:uncharacterized repeat protein (TIGR03803 family)